MSIELRCYRCGEALTELSPPISRRDMCPACAVHLHVCRMCEHYDPAVIKQCREDDAEEVLDKSKANFCEWYSPSATAWNGTADDATARARASLDALFGDDEPAAEAGDDLSEAEKLFR